MPKYDLEKLTEAVCFNTVEVLPNDPDQLKKELQKLIDFSEKSGQPLRHYIGFEISGQIHLGTGMMTALKIKKLQDAGVKCSIWMANYHTWLNNKLDGKLETIKKFRDVYFLPVFLKCCEVSGCNVEDIEFLNADELYNTKRQGYGFWDYFMKTSKNLTLARVVKSVTIMGKQAGEGVEFGTLCYPPMQVADAFFMQTHFVHAGLDQRKCHVLMREVAPHMDEGFELKIGNEKIKPIAIHHHLLLSLGVSAEDAQKRMDAGVAVTEELKMSKSKPDSAVWVSDNFDEISRKLKKAYCPMPNEEQDIEQIMQIQSLNPILNWCKYLVYPSDLVLEVERPDKFGGNITYSDYLSLEKDYFSGKLHPLDLKNALAKTLANWLAPINEYVSKNSEGVEMLKQIKK